MVSNGSTELTKEKVEEPTALTPPTGSSTGAVVDPVSPRGSTEGMIRCLDLNSSAAAAPLVFAPARAACDTDFVMKADPETLQQLPRRKMPRMPGCSMRDWAALLLQKEAQQRRHSVSGHHPQPYASDGRAGLAMVGKKMLPRYTAQEVSQHCSPDDLWIVINNVVYDCTKFQQFHPGGGHILMACGGRDATAVYEAFHPWISCESMMGPYAVGVVVAASHSTLAATSALDSK